MTRARPESAKRRKLFATALLGMAVLALTLASAPPSQAGDPFLRRTATVDVVEKVGPSVVNITTERVSQAPSPFPTPSRPGNAPFADRFFDQFFEPRSRTVQSLGSGVIFDRKGHVLTNEHVVARADRVRVTIADGREFDAELIGADPNNDLAVLRILTDEALPFTPPGNSSDLMVGEPVIAIGNPFGFSNTVTTGVISALNRSVNAKGGFAFHGLLQTDAAINPGNSGGPLLNAEGKLVGINAAIYDGAQGIGFAIPVGVAERVIRELLLYGEVHPVWLGLEFQDIDPALRGVLDLPNGLGGALVNRLNPASPASRAGVRRGDIVASLDGRAVKSAHQLFEMLEGMTAGQKLDLELYREGEFRKAAPVAEELPQAMVLDIASRRLGLELELSERVGAFEVKEVNPRSAAEALGLRRGDYLIGINGVDLHSNDDLRRAVARLRGRARALVVVQRGPGRYHLTLPLI
ncbi:MAG: trypsin-like peptidase domain-containing protein [Myxococcota bacterium]